MTAVALSLPDLPAIRIRNLSRGQKPGMICTQHNGDRWLVLSDLGDPDDSVVEVRMLPDETARECADRLAKYGRGQS